MGVPDTPGIAVDLQDVVEVLQEQVTRLNSELVMQGAYIRKLLRDNNGLVAQISELKAVQTLHQSAASRPEASTGNGMTDAQPAEAWSDPAQG